MIRRSMTLHATPSRKGGLTSLGLTVTLSFMIQGKKKSSGSREASKKGPPLGLVIVLAAAGGAILGSAGTFYFSKPLAAPQQSAAPAAGEAPPAPTFAMPPQQRFTPAPQPPGEVPPGKVWSVEHGHWHDAPVGLAPSASLPPTLLPAAPPIPAPLVVPRNE